MKKKFYITTAIPYVNSSPHIGFALELVQTDVIARYKRFLGEDVFFLTGTDENAQKNAIAAEKIGIKVKKFVDQNAKLFFNLTKRMNISNDDFIRTSDKKRHWIGAKKLWNSCKENGDIYKKKYSGLYCTGCEAFLTKKDLIDGLCPEHLKKPEEIIEENYFFRLSKYEKKLLNIIKNEELKIIPETRKNEVLNFIKDGLEDFSVSRPTDRMRGWGIPVPDDSTQTIYVWFDALANYITALGFGRDEKNFGKYWPADIHVIGKGITRFHAIYWPAMLMSAGLELPRSIFVHGYITVGGKKISKSLGNVVDPFEIIQKYGSDQLRYYLIRDFPVFDDADFSEKSLVDRVNNEIVSKYSNLFYRITTFIVKNFDNLDSVKANKTKLNLFQNEAKKYFDSMDNCRLNDALAVLIDITNELNKYFQEEKPWETIKKDEEKCKETLKTSLELIKNLSLLFYPFIPSTTEKALKLLGVTSINLDSMNKEVKGKIKTEMLMKFIDQNKIE